MSRYRFVLLIIAIAVLSTDSSWPYTPTVVIQEGAAQTAVAVVNGRPAIVYIEYRDYKYTMKYVRAGNINGTSWGTPVVIEENAYYVSLAIVNGHPAISYAGSSGEPNIGAVKYVRAEDEDGRKWGPAVIVDTGGDIGWGTSLTVVNGHPAIAYRDVDNSNVKYVRAENANGTSWETSIVIDSGTAPSIAIVNGHPAIAYYGYHGYDFSRKFRRASDPNGQEEWETPIAVVPAYSCSNLVVVGGKPSFTCTDMNSQLKFFRADNSNGSSWSTSVNIDTVYNPSYRTESLAVIDGRPVLAYTFNDDRDLKIAISKDAYGFDWEAPLVIDVGTSGETYIDAHSELIAVDERPAICFAERTDKNLFFISGLDEAGTSDVLLEALEVTQGTQDFGTHVPLIEYRPTFVRAHVRSTSGEALLNVSARLSGWRNNTEYLGELVPDNRIRGDNTSVGANTLDIKPVPEKLVVNEAFLFELDREWRHGDVTLTLQIDTYSMACLDSGEDCAVQVSFEEGFSPQIQFVGVNWEDANHPGQGAVAEEDIWSAAAQLYATMPVKLFSFLPPAYMETMGRPDKKWELYFLGRKLAAKRKLDGCITSEGCQTYYVGVLTDPPLFEAYTAGYAPGDYVSVGYNSELTISHEFGHNLGRRHTLYTGKEPGPDVHFPTDGTIGFEGVDSFYIEDREYGPFEAGQVLGLDHRTFDVIPSYFADVMSYDHGTRWPSPFTVIQIQRELSRRHDLNLSKKNNKEEHAIALGEPVVLVSCQIDLSSSPTGNLDTLLVIDSPTSMSLPEPGPSVIRLEDLAGNEIASYSFSGFESNDDDVLSATLILPWDDATRRVVLFHDGTELGWRTASLSTPSVEVIFPNGGETLDQPTESILWSAHDNDGDPLKFTLQYSADGGQSWNTLVVDWEQQSYELVMSQLRGTSTGLIRVLASDGFHTVSDKSDSNFQVPNRRPVPRITSPNGQLVLVAGQFLKLRGFAYDAEDKFLDAGSLSWISDFDGLLGTGGELSIDTEQLSTGQHIISLRAEDSSGDWADVNISVEIVEDPPSLGPTLTVVPHNLRFETVEADDSPPDRRQVAIRNEGGGNCLGR